MTSFEFLKKKSNSGPIFLAKTAVTTSIKAITTKIVAITTKVAAFTSLTSSSHLQEIKKIKKKQQTPLYEK